MLLHADVDLDSPTGPVEAYVAAVGAGERLAWRLDETLAEFGRAEVAPLVQAARELGADPAPILEAVAELLHGIADRLVSGNGQP